MSERGIVLAVIAGALIAASPAAAAPITCDATDLVQGIKALNLGSGGTISLPSRCTIDLTAVDNHWYGPNALPPITTPITIEGNGSTIERSAAAGTPTMRLFFVGADPNAAATPGFVSPGGGSLTLEDLTLSGGSQQGGSSGSGGGGAGMGGAIFNMGALSLKAVTLTGNSATGGSTDVNSSEDGGGGMGSSGSGGVGGGFGGPLTGATLTTGSSQGGGGGFVVGENATTASGGGPDTGFGGGTGGSGGTGGDGAGGGYSPNGSSGGRFGSGGLSGGFGGYGGGGGVGGGGGGGQMGGGGGFGGGAGGGGDGDGGFGGGSGVGLASGGFGGGTNGDQVPSGGGGAGMGGAVFNLFGSVSLVNSTLSANSAVGGYFQGQGLGGAIFNVDGSVSVTNSTLYGNTAPQGGGAIYSLGYDADATRAALQPASVTVLNSILAGSTDGQGQAVSDIVNNVPATVTGGATNHGTSAATASGPNIIDSGTITGTAPITTDAKLGALAFNGGPGMETMLPQSGSPALHAGTHTGCPATDERGAPRSPADGCDLGAVQASGPLAQTGPATDVGATTVTLTGTAWSSVGSGASAGFEYGTSTSYGQPSSPVPLGPGALNQPVAIPVTGLAPHTTYHFELEVVSTATGTTSFGGDETVTTNGPPVPLGPASISGTPTAAASLTCNSSWNYNATSFTYQWSRDGTTIPGATGQSYTVQPGDASDTISCQVSASTQYGSSSPETASIAIPIPPPPGKSSPPSIGGTAKKGATLSCSPGTWSNNPTLFSYQWYRNGTPIQGATSSSYKVQASDEGTTLSCTVTATNRGGSVLAASTGINVPVPHVHLCPGASGSLSGTHIGLAHLGMSSKQAHHAFTHSSHRGFKYKDFFCLTPHGVRVGYASPKLLKTLSRRDQRKLTGHVVWISTDNARYAIHGIRAGATLTATRRALPRGYYFRVGKNWWYLAPTSKATAVLKVRNNIVQEIGIADKHLTTSHKADRALMTSFD